MSDASDDRKNRNKKRADAEDTADRGKTASQETSAGEEQEPQGAAAGSGEAVSETGAAGGDGGDDRTTLPATAGGDDDRGRGGIAIAVLALVLALLLGGAGVLGGWWVWERLEYLEARTDDAASQMEVAELRESLGSRDERLTGRVENLADEHASHVRALATVEESMTTVREDQQRIRENMERIEELAAAHRDDWIFAEASYLFGIARYRAEFHRDVDGALAALREADRLLKELGGESVDERQRVARAIDALLAVSPPDRPALAADLRKLVDGVGDWELARAERRVEPTGIPGQRDADLSSLEGWREASQRAWAQFREAVSALVVVRRDDPPPRLMAPEESQYLRHNLQLQLLTARLALLDGDEATYRDSLATAGEWLEMHFDTDTEAVSDALTGIERLREAPIRADVPDLSEYLPDQRVPGRHENGATDEEGE